MWEALATLEDLSAFDLTPEAIDEIRSTFTRVCAEIEAQSHWKPIFHDGLSIAHSSCRRIFEHAIGESSLDGSGGELLWSAAKVQELDKTTRWDFELSEVFEPYEHWSSPMHEYEHNLTRLFWQICVENKFGIFFSY